MHIVTLRPRSLGMKDAVGFVQRQDDGRVPGQSWCL